MLFEIGFSSLLIKVVTFTVNDDHQRHLFYIKSAECFGLKVFVGNKFCFLDAFRKKCSCPADRC